MWLTYLAVLLVIVAIFAAIAGGGIFTIILVPLAVIAVLAAVWSSAGARASGAETTAEGGATHASRGTAPLPRRRSRGSGRAPSSPGALADARREQQ